MTANSKRHVQPEMRDRASKRREELAEEVQTLRRAGKIREAKGVEGRAQQVDQLIGALEGPVEPASRPS
jgi:transcription elongation GreA/GreB family factor